VESEHYRGGYFEYINDCTANQFIFACTAFQPKFSIIPEKRISLTEFPLVNLIKSIKPHVVKDKTAILANADNDEYALSHILTVDTKFKKIDLKLDEKPLLGLDFIASEELDTINVHY